MSRTKIGMVSSLTFSLLTISLACSKRPAEAPPAGSSATASQTSAAAPPTAAVERTIAHLYPSEVRAGKTFNVMVDGRSGLGVTGTGFTRADLICWNGQALKTVYGNPGWLTAGIPSEWLANAEDVVVSVRDPGNPAAAEPRQTFRITK